MFVSFDVNEFHHLTIQEIIDRTYTDIPYLLLKCNGKTLKRDTNTIKGVRTIPYRIHVLVKSNLINYVLSELSPKDNIFVIGRCTEYTVKAGNYYRAIDAQCIYKEDWMNYYKRANLTDGEM